MADYFPLIARAVEGLERNTAENRRTLYERARSALVAQLRGMDPPLDEADITRERLALEESIRKVESEAARRGRPDESDVQRPRGDRPSLTDEGLKDFRDVMAEAEHLGEATSKASRAAREFYDQVPHDDGNRDAAAPPAADSGETMHEPPRAEGVPEPRAEDHAPAPAGHDEPAAGLESAPIRGKREPWPPPPPAAHGVDDADEFERPRRSYRGLIRTLVILILVGAVAAAGYWQRGRIVTLASSIMRSGPASQPQQPQREPTQVRPKITDRIGAEGQQPNAGRAANAPAAAVAQKVVLYEEDTNDPQGKRYVGSAVWKTETVSPGPGLAPELAVRADVDIPERRIHMTMSLRRNTDKALPASHTIEIIFTLPADFPDGAINNVPGVLMKQTEETRGVPLAGLAVKVTNGFFLIGLSSVDVDLQRNVQLLKERAWFDVPLVYTSGRRAILALEKGTPGERAFEEAFRAWGQ